MEATQLLFSPPMLRRRRLSLNSTPCRKSQVVRARGGANGPEHQWGDIVDENMIVLRMRIKEMHELETSYEPPPNWMEWEKKYYVHYNEDVCEAMMLLQTYLINVRPSLGLGMVALVFFSVLASAGAVAYCAVEMVIKGILLPGFHHN